MRIAWIYKDLAATDKEESEWSDISESDSEKSSSENGELEIYFAVSAKKSETVPTEQDTVALKCAALRKRMRRRPCLPLNEDGSEMSYSDVCSGKALPCYSCPYEDCNFHTKDRCMFLHHVAGGVSDPKHAEMLREVLQNDLPWMTNLDYVYGAAAVAERERWPRIGLSTTRRALNILCRRYNDENIQCLACFVCGQLRTTCSGYPEIDLTRPVQSTKRCNVEIDWRSDSAFGELETCCPGTLLNNCSYNLWQRRYIDHQEVRGKVNPLREAQPIVRKFSECTEAEKGRHISEWALQVPVNLDVVTLFGCTEDICCEHAAKHAEDFEVPPFTRRVCKGCRVPVCCDCWEKMQLDVERGSVPMSLGNDQYYGYVHRFLVENDVTWLECAAASVCWSTMLVYYLEDPFGHLMGEKMGSVQGRTKVRGNLFSFSMPWQDIEKCCAAAIANAGTEHKEELRKLQSELGIPHSEETLALLVSVHIRGGSKDLAQHLQGLTMRVAVVEELIRLLRASGHAGYEEGGVNGRAKVAARLKERYTDIYGMARFQPAAVRDAICVRAKDKISIVQDKVATPAEPERDIKDWVSTLRPNHLVAEKSTNSQANIHENYRNVFKQFGTFDIQTGSTFTEQFDPRYLGMAFPFTMPIAVGGYDVPNAARWRRPEDEDFPYPRQVFSGWLDSLGDEHAEVRPACEVRLFDITRGLPQRIEGQYRRHWGFTPALWNLYFRERVRR